MILTPAIQFNKEILMPEEKKIEPDVRPHKPIPCDESAKEKPVDIVSNVNPMAGPTSEDVHSA